MVQEVFRMGNEHRNHAIPVGFELEVHTKLTQLKALDAEIVALEQQTTPLPGLLAALIRHPVLWLLVGREGIDRPGGLENIVGQQLITVRHANTQAMVMTAIGMLVLGILMGIGGCVLWSGGI